MGRRRGRFWKIIAHRGSGRGRCFRWYVCMSRQCRTGNLGYTRGKGGCLLTGWGEETCDRGGRGGALKRGLTLMILKLIKYSIKVNCKLLHYQEKLPSFPPFIFSAIASPPYMGLHFC